MLRSASFLLTFSQNENVIEQNEEFASVSFVVYSLHRQDARKESLSYGLVGFTLAHYYLKVKIGFSLGVIWSKNSR